MMTHVITSSFPEEDSHLRNSTLGIINPTLRLLSRGGADEVLDFHELRVTRVQSLKCIGVYLGSVMAPKVCWPLSTVTYNSTDETVSFEGVVGVGIVNVKVTDKGQDMPTGHRSKLSRTVSDPSGGRAPLHQHNRAETEMGTGIGAGEQTVGGKSRSQRADREAPSNNIGTDSDKKRCRESSRDTTYTGRTNTVPLSSLIAQRFTPELHGLWTPLQQLMAKFWSKVLHYNRGKSEFR